MFGLPLALPAALDAIATVGTFNRSIIDNWHYFISVRMMALASIISFLVLLSSNEVAVPYMLRYPAVVLFSALAMYILLGYLGCCAYTPSHTRLLIPAAGLYKSIRPP